MSLIRKLKSQCDCDNGLREGWFDDHAYCLDCNWEYTCQSEECDNEDVNDDGYCYECQFERSIAAIDFYDNE